MRITDVTSTDLFGGTVARPLAIVRVTLEADAPGGEPGPFTVRVEGPAVSTPQPAVVTGPEPGQPRQAEVAVEVAAPHVPGTPVQVTVIAEGPGGQRAERSAAITTGEPGWTMWMVSHFHYDPVWWSTQGQFTQARIFLPDADGRVPDARVAFELVRLHLDEARRDRDYKFVLAEIDYLKPHFDAHPEDRADLLRFIREGRIEIVGGSYNEPNTNLTGAESTIRNAVYGLAFQREVLGADPSAAWMLDAFGFDPAYPGLMAAAGMAESAWARGPFHQWGPNRTVGDNRRMQFASEFEWLSPDGTGLLTSYMANHYGAGYVTHRAASLPAAEQAALEQFRQLAPVAATRNVLLPVGADHVIPSRWVTGIHRDWNSRYVWPRFVTALPSEFFAAVRKDAAERDVWITPQTRDMNPVYTGKDVSYIDTKQAQRAAEIAVTDGEKLATLAWLAGAPYPAAGLDKAWRQLVFGAHHDAITGTEGDQVYLDLLAGWREAYERGDAARRDAARHLAGLAATATAAVAGQDEEQHARAVVVFNTLSQSRSGLARIVLDFAAPGPQAAALRDDAGHPVPALAEGVTRHPDGTLAGLALTFRAEAVPALGYRTYVVTPLKDGSERPGSWEITDGSQIENAAYLAVADPAHGGTLARVLDKRSGADLLAGPGNELVLQEEYDHHPRWNEGPWILCPKGPGRGTAGVAATVRAERCPIGSRLVAEFEVDDLRVTQETVLWDGAERIEFRTHVDGSIGQDRLLRVRFPARVPGGLPVYQSALAVVGRPPGPADTDVAEHEFTLDNPAHEWFGVGSTARVAVAGPGGVRRMRAIGVAEVITPAAADGCREAVRDLIVALARAGVTATCSRADGPRYGSIDVDSNLPDVRIALGGPGENAFTADVLAAAGLSGAGLSDPASGVSWMPAAQTREAAFTGGADLRGVRDLPVLIVTGADLGAAIAAVTADLADAVIEADEASGAAGTDEDDLAGHTVVLLNRGTPSSLVTADGTMNISLMRACSTWPCGVWIDGDRRFTPDGTSFAWQHWSHTFEYALAAGPGDWREAGFPLAGLDYNHDLLACETGLHEGPLPASASLAAAEPATAVVSALKPRGNPLVPAAQPRPEDGVTVRLRDTSGRCAPTAARVRLFTGLIAARGSGPLEEGDGPPLRLESGAALADLPASGTATIAAIPDRTGPGGSAGNAGAASSRSGEAGAVTVSVPPEPAQPVFTRYWLHGKGPAPAGNLPVAVHLSPVRTALAEADSPGEPDGLAAAATLRLTVACGTDPASGTVHIDPGGPADIEVEPDAPLRYELGPLGHAGWDLTVRARPGARHGRHFVAARITGDDGQVFEDAVLVSIGEPAAPALDLPLEELFPLYLADQQKLAAELDLELAQAQLRLPPGGSGRIAATLRNATRSPVRGEAQLVSPFGSWVQTAQWTRGFTAGPQESVTLDFSVTVPAAARPRQQWWALVKVMYFGRVRYSEPIAVTITDAPAGNTP
ncbi:MAG TPA: glycoside hydrolase family 38 C-terminal domain-containing protein [Streptosporangiaceae bacterium]|nr:glycoside hydrolase family 38 C-terminal domain-containing protein [Streptosporangiaceae bacterium]